MVFNPKEPDMSGVHRYAMLASFLCLIVSAAGPPKAMAADRCENLPPSKLQVLTAKAADLEERGVPPGELAQDVPAGVIASRHSMMLMVSDTVSWFDIVHRVLPRGDGSVCDSPELVRMGFGTNGHTVLLAQAVADDACVRREMLDHAAAHVRAFDTTVERFIDEQTMDFQQGMKALKQTPAPNTEIVTARWRKGLQLIVAQAKEQLLDDLRAANARVDTPPVLAALENACGGRIKELARRGSL